MSLNPEIREFLERYAAAAAALPNEPLTLAKLREYFTFTWSTDCLETVGSNENRTIPGPAGELPVRIYTPEKEGPHPVLVFYHGGGFVLGGLDSHDSICRMITNDAEVIVVSVDYRLAPEHPFPAAVEDAWAALEWVAQAAAEGRLNADPSRIAVGGDSAGGNLSAVMTRLSKERGGPSLAHQLLIYPAVSLDFSTLFPSMEENAEGYLLTLDSIRWFYSQYLRSGEDALDTSASPLLAADLSGLPPVLSLLHNMIRCVMKEKPMPSGCRKQGWRLNTNAVKE